MQTKSIGVSALSPDMTQAPKRQDRKAAAAFVSHHYFKVSHRTLEAAPLTWRRVNGRALVETAELIAWAEAKLAAAPAVRGGRADFAKSPDVQAAARLRTGS